MGGGDSPSRADPAIHGQCIPLRGVSKVLGEGEVEGWGHDIYVVIIWAYTLNVLVSARQITARINYRTGNLRTGKLHTGNLHRRPRQIYIPFNTVAEPFAWGTFAQGNLRTGMFRTGRFPHRMPRSMVCVLNTNGSSYVLGTYPFRIGFYKLSLNRTPPIRKVVDFVIHVINLRTSYFIPPSHVPDPRTICVCSNPHFRGVIWPL